MHHTPACLFWSMHRHPEGVHPKYFGTHREQGRRSTVLSTRFLSSVSTKKCLDATNEWSWISGNQHRHKYISTKIHKYLDHCTCDEHEEKKILGLHGAVGRLQLWRWHWVIKFYFELGYLWEGFILVVQDTSSVNAMLTADAFSLVCAVLFLKWQGSIKC